MAPARPCKHTDLQLDVSSHADEVDFVRPPPAKRAAAATPSGRTPKTPSPDEDALKLSFPGPLLLPDDALAIDPDDPPQSLLSWIREEMRNPFTQARKTIYVVPVPTISGQVSFMKDWVSPAAQAASSKPVESPKIEDILKYVAAFYHPLPVKLLPGKSAFVQWNSSARTRPTFVGLQLGADDGVTRIRTRPCPDGAFGRQLNLNDILDAAIEALPGDAYAISVMTEHDLYEDEDDDFCCGRAYGSSRVSVVSAARYHPALDADLDRTHMWPASHCREYVEGLCRAGAAKKRSKKSGQPANIKADEDSPIRAAITAAQAAGDPSSNLHGLWFSRVARTISHEIGHCLCLAHCPYYACVMQSTMGMAEDVRQPPYLCPICLAKVSRAILEVNPGVDEKQFVTRRYLALQKFCEGWPDIAMFAGFHAWLGERIESFG